MKKFKFTLFFITIGLLVTAFGSAALSSVNLDNRSISGAAVVDTDANAAIKFEKIIANTGFLTVDGNGVATVDLTKAFTSGASLNTSGTFVIGATTGAIKITNNSDQSVTVTVTGTGVTLTPITGSSATIASGGSGTYSFTVATPSAAGNITATLKVAS